MVSQRNNAFRQVDLHRFDKGLLASQKRGRFRRLQAMHFIAAALVVSAGLSYGR
jgi:hypothetical protein